MTKKISLTRGFMTIVDDDWYEMLSQVKWFAVRGRPTQSPYAASSHCQDRMHRIITDAPKELHVDHINGDTLDNRKSNLRLCTLQQNSFNQRVRKHKKSSIYKGVFYIKHIDKWNANTRVNGKWINLGYYSSEYDAALAYNEGVIKHHGEFARLNIIERR